MRRAILSIVFLASAGPLQAQSFWNSSLRTAPQFYSYEIAAPFSEKVSQFSFPMFVVVPVLPALTVDVGTAFAIARLERTDRDASGNPVTTESEMSGLTDTQIRANYTVGQDLLVLTAGVNVPTGSATVNPEELEAATRIGSDFLLFPISGFGSGLGFTGGVAFARPAGNWNVGIGASVRQSTEYEPFRDASGTATKFQPGPEYRARAGIDRPFGTGRMSFGLTYSKFGDDKSNAAVFNSGDRYIAQFTMNNSLRSGVDYSFVMWNLYRTSGTLINSDPSPSGNITNAMITFGVRGPGSVGIEPSIETRVWTQEGSRTSYLGNFGIRFFVDRGSWAVVPGVGFTVGAMESASLTGFRATLGARLGG